MYIGNTPFQGLVGGGNILDASIEGVDLSTSAIAARLGYTPVDPGAAVFSANPTISSGTANSIAYLNGSKVVSSGSGLTYDGTNFATTGNITGSNLAVTNTNWIGWGNYNTRLQGDSTNNTLVFTLNATEQARLTTDGFGIKTASPIYPLQVGDYTTSTTTVLAIAGTVEGRLNFGDGTSGVQANAGRISYFHGSDYMAFYTNVNEAVRIDSSGNFKLNGGYMSFGNNGYIRADSAGWLQLQGGTSGTRIMNSSNASPLVTLDNAGNFQIGTTVGGAKFLVGTSESKSQNATPFSLTTNDASNRFELVVARNTNSYYSFQAVEQNVAYRNIVLQQDGGRVGIGQTDPQEKLDVNGNVYIHTATGNPYLKIKTDGAGNNPTVRLQADSSYWDIQGTFSNTHDDLQFLYNGVNKLAFSNNSIGGLSISNGNNQYGRLTVDTDGLQHVVRGGSLNGADYYYRFLKLFKLKTGVNTGNSTEVKGRLHISRVNEIGVSQMVDFYASQGYSGQIRTWYNRIAGPEGATNFRFVTLVDNGNTYLCLEFISAPGWNSWQFEGSIIDYDGGRGSFAVTAVENLTTKEVGPWTTPMSDPSTALLQDSTYSPLVVGIFNYNYIPAGTNVTVASTHIFGAPQTSGSYGEAARITSNGNVLIGTTSANGGSLQIKRNSGLTHTTSAIQIDSYDADWYTTLHIGSIDTYDIGYIQTAAKNQSFSTKSLSLQPNGGNVGIGTSLNSNNTSKLTVWGDTQLYAGTSGQSPSLVFGAETGAPKKAIFLSSFWLTIQGHNNEGIRMQTVDANGNATTRMTVAGTGAVTIPGSLSKGSGSFRIPHPLPSKSESHELVHSFIEGPQADLIYRGKVALASGQAVINIDAATGMTSGTFEVLCREVQCFTTNESGWTAIKGKVVGNILTIEAQDPACTDEVSWMVIGERKDQHMMDTDWTDENGKVIVEPLKPVAETQGGNQ